jgi:hypothetical protein
LLQVVILLSLPASPALRAEFRAGCARRRHPG